MISAEIDAGVGKQGDEISFPGNFFLLDLVRRFGVDPSSELSLQFAVPHFAFIGILLTLCL